MRVLTWTAELHRGDDERGAVGVCDGRHGNIDCRHDAVHDGVPEADQKEAARVDRPENGCVRGVAEGAGPGGVGEGAGQSREQAEAEPSSRGARG